MRCIWCGEEIEGSIRDHMAEKHIGVKKDSAAAPPTIPDPPKPIPIEEPKKTEKPDTPTLPMEKPKKRYLDAAEIITLLQNTNKRFPLKELAGCPLTKENE